MSDTADRLYGEWAQEGVYDPPNMKQLEKELQSNLYNMHYVTAMDNHFLCTSTYFSENHIVGFLQKQLMRPDIETVCGYELLQMKKLFLESDVLDYHRFLEKPVQNWSGLNINNKSYHSNRNNKCFAGVAII